MTTIREDDAQETRDLLLGHRIVSAEIGSFTVPSTESWNDTASGRMVLDDGTVIYVIPNEGGCVCGAGDYALEHLATVDNVITDVRVATEDGEYGALSYRIYVVADAVEINAVQIDGDDGNGYYGTGYSLTIVPGGAA